MRTVVAALLCLLTLVYSPLRAQERDAFEVEEELLRKLRRLGMPKYMELQYRVMSQDFPGRKDELQFLYATTRRSRSERIKLLKGIPSTSRRYHEAVWEIAKATPKPEEKAKILRKLHAELTVGTPPAEKLRGKVGRELLAALIASKQQVPEELLKDLVSDKRSRSFWLAKTKLNQADELSNSKRPEDRRRMAKLAGDALQIITKDSDLMWTPDYWNAMAYVEAGRAHLLLGDLKSAAKSMDTIYKDGTLTKIEKEIRKNRGDVAKLSPLASMCYYLARLRLAQAQKLEGRNADKEQRKKLLTEALKLFFKVEREYPGHEYEAEAIAGFDQVAGILRKEFNAKIKRPEIKSQRLYEMGMACYQNEDWEKAHSLLTKVAKRNYKSKGAADALFYATACLYKLNRHLEAQAMAELMADVQPKNQRTHDMLSMAGNRIYKASFAIENAAMQSRYRTGVTSLYTLLLKLAPGHSQAPAAALFMARGKLALADSKKAELDMLRKKGVKDREGKEKLSKATLDMQAAFLEALRAYEEITRKYGRTWQATSAYFSLGRIQSVLGNRREAAAQYLEYVDRERRKTPMKILAKMYAANHLTGLGKHEEAHPHWQDVLKWANSEAYDRKDPDVERAYRAALANAPMRDFHAGKKKIERAKELEKQAKEIELQIEMLEQQLQD